MRSPITYFGGKTERHEKSTPSWSDKRTAQGRLGRTEIIWRKANHPLTLLDVIEGGAAG